MLRDLWTGAVGQQLALLLGAAILAMIGLNRGLAPLLRLRKAVLRRRSDELVAFDPQAVQRELRPRNEALNPYIKRIEHTTAEQRRFVGNAANPTKKPLTQDGREARRE